MKIVILNIPSYNAYSYLKEFEENIRKYKKYKDAEIIVISEDINKKENIMIETLNLTTISELPSNPEILLNFKEEIDYFVILSKTDDNDPDGYTFDIIHRLNDLNTSAKIIAECNVDSERARLVKAGASALIRPTRTYPTLLVKSIVEEGNEIILEKLIDIKTKYNVVKVEKKIDWMTFLIENYDKGLALGFVDYKGNITINPKHDEICTIKYALFY